MARALVFALVVFMALPAWAFGPVSLTRGFNGLRWSDTPAQVQKRFPRAREREGGVYLPAFVKVRKGLALGATLSFEGERGTLSRIVLEVEADDRAANAGGRAVAEAWDWVSSKLGLGALPYATRRGMRLEGAIADVIREGQGFTVELVHRTDDPRAGCVRLLARVLSVAGADPDLDPALKQRIVLSGLPERARLLDACLARIEPAALACAERAERYAVIKACSPGLGAILP